jgi:hypothetical protein
MALYPCTCFGIFNLDFTIKLFFLPYSLFKKLLRSWRVAFLIIVFSSNSLFLSSSGDYVGLLLLNFISDSDFLIDLRSFETDILREATSDTNYEAGDGCLSFMISLRLVVNLRLGLSADILRYYLYYCWLV